MIHSFGKHTNIFNENSILIAIGGRETDVELLERIKVSTLKHPGGITKIKCNFNL